MAGWTHEIVSNFYPIITGSVATNDRPAWDSLLCFQDEIEFSVELVDQNPLQLRPEKLISLIKEQQREHVKESYGAEAYQCFTDVDLNEFLHLNIPEKITNQLKKDKELEKIVLAIKAMSPSEQQKLLNTGLNTFRSTWAELGRIDKAGQTEAGQKAEKMIAQAIVRLVKEELSKL